jgi:WD40 repeat protein
VATVVNYDPTIKLWDVATGKELGGLKGHREQVKSLAFSQDGKTLVSGSYDRTVWRWDVHACRPTATLRLDGAVSAVPLGPDGKTTNSIKLFTSQPISAVAFGSDGKVLAFDGGTIHRWDPATQEHTTTRTKYGASGAFSPDSKTLACTAYDGTIQLVNVGTGKVAATLSVPEARQTADWRGHQVYSLAFSPDGRTLASGSKDGRLMLWNVTTGKEIGALKGQDDSVWGLAFSPDGMVLASGQWGKVKLWDVATRKEITRLAHDRPVHGVAFSPDGKTLAAGNGDAVEIWDVSTLR